MKNYITSTKSVLTLKSEGIEDKTVDLYSEEGFDMLSNLWIKVAAEKKLMYENSWLGRPIIQFPSDIVVIQELIWKIKPDVIIETGVAHGGSLVLSASILELIGKGEVIGIDIDIREHNRIALDQHPLRKRIKLIEGSSISQDVIDQVKSMISEDATVMVMLDSNHSENHVLRELELYSPLVSKESYIIAHDASQAWVWDIPRGKKEWKEDHPLKAIETFTENNHDYVIDHEQTRWGITSSPYGYIQRKK